VCPLNAASKIEAHQMSLIATQPLASLLEPTMVSVVAVAVALVIDRGLGEPPLWAHPVVAMGRYLGALGPALLRLPPNQALWGGALAWCFGALVVLALSLAAEMVVAVLVWSLPSGDALLRGLLLGIVLKPFLAWRMLRDEVAGVEQALGRSLDEGRAQLKRLVSRDVTELDEAGVRESAIESLAENLNDSLVAPLFWFALAGLPGAALYRFANTADAMWGYRGRYEWVGKWAAHADDVLSWVPARLTAILLCLAARRWPGLPLMRQEAALTPSPNGGWPMGTMARLLNVCLRKPGVYALNGRAAPPQARHMVLALQWAAASVVLAAGCAMGWVALWGGLIAWVRLS
jgi:adenosylcobinamide-phosphate synthase